MEVLTAPTQTGTVLRIDSDRQFEGKPGDSVLRMAGESKDGSQVFDATYVECSAEEAHMVGWILRSIRQPSPELLEKMAQEIQATFSHLSGRDAHQAAEVAWSGIWSATGLTDEEMKQHVTTLAERFERASSRAKQPYGTAHAGGNGEPSHSSSGSKS